VPQKREFSNLCTDVQQKTRPYSVFGRKLFGGFPMRCLSVAIVVAVSAIAPAQLTSAADMPIKAPPPVAAIYDWTGFYVGGNLGYSIGRDPSSVSFGPPFIQHAPSFTLAPAGWLAGGQFGYNWQTDNFVIGLEADWQWTGQKDSACLSLCAPSTEDPSIFFGTAVDQKLKWFGTARARIGYAADRWLWYLTGGAAWGRVETNLPYITSTSVTGANFDNTKGGWALGAGIETGLSGNWSGKLEYLYMDLGSITGIINVNIPGAVPGTVPVTSDIRDHIIRVGLNYRLTGGPVAGAATPTYKTLPAASYNWRGFYVGVNSGYSIGRDGSTDQLLVPQTLTNESYRLAPAGWLAGGQFGYNWQMDNFVVGLEADWQWTGQKDSACVIFCASPPGGNYPFLTEGQKLKWFGTARARIGYAANHWLWYLTGGAAWARVETNVTAGNNVTPITASASFGQTKNGGVIGVGVETAFTGNWSAKLEYLYMQLGNTTNILNYNILGCSPCTVTTSSDIRDHVFRVGINYRFAPTVVATKY
jgi:outer membrane immunogenic protein